MKMQAITMSLLAVATLLLSGCSEEEKKPQEQPVKEQESKQQTVKQQEESPATDSKADQAQEKVMPTDVVHSLKEGADYSVMADKEATSEPLVYEFFSYTCPHCYNLEPVMQEWKKGFKPDEVTFQRVPVFIPQVAHLTYGFYTAEELDVLEKFHLSVFVEWHEKQNIIRTKEDLIPIFESIGVSKEDFESTYSSAEVEAKVENAKELINTFQVTSFPLIVINEKFKVLSYQNLEELLGNFAIDNTK